MALPNGVSVQLPGQEGFVSQRGYWTPPYDSCMFASLCMIMEPMGYVLPLNRAQPKPGEPDNFVHALHVASGKPLNQGTNTADTKRALTNLFGAESMPAIYFALITDAVLLDRLAKDWYIRVSINMGKMPRHLKRWCGYSFNGKHAMAITDARKQNGVDQVFIRDPMGRNDYVGEWVAWADISGAVARSNGMVAATLAQANTAYEFKPAEPTPPTEPPVITPPPVDEKPEETMPLIVGGVKDQYVPLKKGTALLRPDTLAIVTRVAVDSDFRMSGMSEDSKYLAVNVRSQKLPKGAAILFVDSGLAGEPYIKPTVPAEDYKALQDQLADAQGDAKVDGDKLDEIDTIIHR